MRGCQLHDDELHDDIRSIGDGTVWNCQSAFEHRHRTTCNRHVRTKLFYRQVDQPLGAPLIIQLGLALIGMAALVGMLGMSVGHFWLALVLLGVGWNFGFLGASALVLTCHTSEDGPRVRRSTTSLNSALWFSVHFYLADCSTPMAGRPSPV